MNLKKIILSAKSANAKLENKFKSISRISANMLIFGQLFLVLILGAILFYAFSVKPDNGILPDIFKSVQALCENAASGLCVLWLGAIFIDYIEKNRET